MLHKLIVYGAHYMNATNFHTEHSQADYGELQRVFGDLNHPRTLLHLNKQVCKTV